MKIPEKVKKNLAYKGIKEFVVRYFVDRVGRTGAELAYFFLFSFFPLMIFSTLLLGSLNIDFESVYEMLKGLIPTDVLDIAIDYIEYLLTLKMDGLMYTGLVMSIYSASRAVNCLTFAVNRAYRIEKSRNFLLQSLLNLFFTAILLVSILITLVILVTGRSLLLQFAKVFNISEWFIESWNILRFIPVAVLFLSLLSFLYSVIPNRRIRFRQALPGAVFASLSWLAASIGFSFYVENMGRYSILYGSIGAVIVLMLWLYLTGVILIMGAELNHVIYLIKNRDELFLSGSTHTLPPLPKSLRESMSLPKLSLIKDGEKTPDKKSKPEA